MILAKHYKREAWKNLYNLKIAQLKIFHAFNNSITGKFKNIKIRSLQISYGVIKPDPERLRPLVELPVPKTVAELKRCVGMFAYYPRWIKNYSSKIKVLVPKNASLPLNSQAIDAFETLRQD